MNISYEIGFMQPDSLRVTGTSETEPASDKESLGEFCLQGEREWSIQMVYTMWYTLPIYQYIGVIYSIPCKVYTMLYKVYHTAQHIANLAQIEAWMVGAAGTVEEHGHTISLHLWIGRKDSFTGLLL